MMMLSVHPGGDCANAARSILLILRFLIVATNTSGKKKKTSGNPTDRPQNIKPQSKSFSRIKKTQTIKWVKIDPDANNWGAGVGGDWRSGLSPLPRLISHHRHPLNPYICSPALKVSSAKKILAVKSHILDDRDYDDRSFCKMSDWGRDKETEGESARERNCGEV